MPACKPFKQFNKSKIEFVLKRTKLYFNNYKNNIMSDEILFRGNIPGNYDRVVEAVK